MRLAFPGAWPASFGLNLVVVVGAALALGGALAGAIVPQSLDTIRKLDFGNPYALAGNVVVVVGVVCALGTDSLASCPDLDVLAEIPVLARAFPEVPVSRWLAMATHEGAAASRALGVGRVVAGASPGLLHLEVRELEALAGTAPARRWIVAPG